MRKERTRDMTSGAPLPMMLSFMLPLMVGMIFQQFYSMVDTAVVGNYLGVEALAGVGSTGSISFMVLGLCNGICGGFAIPVAQKFGEKDTYGLRNFVGNMIWLGLGLGLLITLATTLSCRGILVLTNTPADTFRYAHDYILIIFMGIPDTMLYNLLAGILRSLGDSRTPLLFLIFSSVLNVLLDLLMVVGFRLGVVGAALATVISQLVSGFLCLFYMAKRFPILHLSRDNLRLRKPYAFRLLMMGLPMGLQYSVTAIGNILLQTAVNGLGAVAMAAVVAGTRVSGIFETFIDSMGIMAATYAGQNLGAGKLDRVRTGVRQCVLMGCVYCLLALGALYFVGGRMAGLFLSGDNAAAAGQIIPLAHRMLIVWGIFYIPLINLNLLRFTIQGLGYSNLAVVSGVFEMVARGGVAIWLVPRMGFDAVCLAGPAAWVMANCFLIPAYLACVRRRAGEAKKETLPDP